MENTLDVANLFMMYEDIDRLIEKNRFNIKNKKGFKGFVISLYRIFSYSPFENNICDIAEIYKEIYNEKIGVADVLVPFKEILDIYNKNSISDFKTVLNNIPYGYNLTDYSKIDITIKYYINYLSKYRREYSIEDFSKLIGYVCMSHYHMPTALRELERLDVFSLNTVAFLVNSGFKEDEAVVSLNIVSSLGLPCNEVNLKLARSNMIYVGKDKVIACKMYAQRHGCVLYDDVMDKEDGWEWFFDSVYKDYIIVKCYNALWGCKKEVFV